MTPRVVALPLVAGLLVLTAASPAAAGRGFELAPIFGYRFGGSTHETESGADADLQGSPAYGVILDVEAREDGQYEFLYTHQSTRLDPTDDSLPYGQEPPDIDTGLTIDTLQVGGLLYLQPAGQAKGTLGQAKGTLVRKSIGSGEGDARRRYRDARAQGVNKGTLLPYAPFWEARRGRTPGVGGMP